MAKIHTDTGTWNRRSMGDSGLENALTEAESLGRLIEDACRSIDNDRELMNSHYITPDKYESEIKTRQIRLRAYSGEIQSQVAGKLEDNMKRFMQRSAELLSGIADLSQYKTANTLGIRYKVNTGRGMGSQIKGNLSFADFMPTKENVKNGKGYYVEAFAKLYSKDYNEIKRAYEEAGAVDELFSEDEYMEYLLHQGRFAPINLDSMGEKVWRGVLNATIIVPIIEAVGGVDVVTGYELTSGERWDQGVAGAVGAFSMALGGFGIIAKGAKGIQVLQYMLGHVFIDMGASAATTLTNEVCQEFLPPEVSRLIAMGVGIAFAMKMSSLYDKGWSNSLSNSKVIGKVDDVKGTGGVKTYTPINKGSLSVDDANTFRSGTYTEKVLTEDTTFFRVHGGASEEVGRFVSRTPQNGGIQSQMDLALNPEWGNTAQNVTQVTVPKGTVIYEGIAAPQAMKDSLGNTIGSLPGGGNQVIIPWEELEPSWFGK